MIALENLPAWLNSDAWAAFCEMRHAKGKRAPFTTLAAKRLLYELDGLRSRGFDPTEVIWQSVVHGWSGFYELKRKHVTPPTYDLFKAEERQEADPARKAEVSEMLRRAKDSLTKQTRH